jgi:hypothetical protein
MNQIMMSSKLLLEMIFIALAVASISMTITKSNIMEKLRVLISKGGSWMKELIHCPYCLCHWLTAGIVCTFYWEIYPFSMLILMIFGIITLACFGSLGIAWLFLVLDDLNNLEEN